MDANNRFRSEDVALGVIGLGYVGLPLAVEAAPAGIEVVGFDVKAAVTDGMNAGLSHNKNLTETVVGEQVEAGRPEAIADMDRLLRVCESARSKKDIDVPSHLIPPHGGKLMFSAALEAWSPYSRRSWRTGSH